MVAHYVGEDHDSDETFSSPHDQGGKIEIGSRGSSGVTEQLILRWEPLKMNHSLNATPQPILVAWAHFNEIYLLSAPQVLRDHKSS